MLILRFISVQASTAVSATMCRHVFNFLIFIYCVAVYDGFPVNSTSNSLLCRTFERDGKEIYGLVRKSQPILELPCYERDDYFNCQAFYGRDKEYCETVCCLKAVKSSTMAATVAIQCKEFEIKGKKVKGFLRETPPLINLPCYEDNGMSNCQGLFEPDRSFCNVTCCNGSSKLEHKDEWALDKDQALAGDRGEAENSCVTKCTNLSWRIISYTFGATTGLLFFALLVSVYFIFKYRRRLYKQGRISYSGHNFDEDPQVALPNKPLKTEFKKCSLTGGDQSPLMGSSNSLAESNV